jgi:hypothetical protein
MKRDKTFLRALYKNIIYGNAGVISILLGKLAIDVSLKILVLNLGIVYGNFK